MSEIPKPEPVPDPFTQAQEAVANSPDALSAIQDDADSLELAEGEARAQAVVEAHIAEIHPRFAANIGKWTLQPDGSRILWSDLQSTLLRERKDDPLNANMRGIIGALSIVSAAVQFKDDRITTLTDEAYDKRQAHLLVEDLQSGYMLVEEGTKYTLHSTIEQFMQGDSFDFSEGAVTRLKEQQDQLDKKADDIKSRHDAIRSVLDGLLPPLSATPERNTFLRLAAVEIGMGFDPHASADMLRVLQITPEQLAGYVATVRQELNLKPRNK